MIINDWDEKERRNQERYSLEYFLRIVDRDTESLLGHIIDISLGGMRLISEAPIPTQKDFRLWMEISLESGLQGKIALEARSVWGRKDINPELYDTGFSFIALSAETRSTIENLIRELSSD
jgi:c-di-GMP-binding flagellar brake protein YcgR